MGCRSSRPQLQVPLPIQFHPQHPVSQDVHGRQSLVPGRGGVHRSLRCRVAEDDAPRLTVHRAWRTPKSMCRQSGGIRPSVFTVRRPSSRRCSFTHQSFCSLAGPCLIGHGLPALLGPTLFLVNHNASAPLVLAVRGVSLQAHQASAGTGSPSAGGCRPA